MSSSMKITTIYLCGVLSLAAAYTATPIIGVLSQETYSINKYFPGENLTSFIAASYVKHLESAGARVVPIWIGQDESYYRKVIQTTNGILFPGGATWFNQSDGYADAGQILYDMALEINKKGDYYPIYAICLGMELLAQVAVGGQELRADCNSVKENLPLEFLPGYRSSKLFSKAPKKILSILEKKNVTYNYHRFCVTQENFTTFGLSRDWNILATNVDKNGMEFISAYESKHYPFYALQFHPEKNPYEFKLNMNYPHTADAILTSQYFANFIVEETRKNGHRFPSWESEQESFIYNYPTYNIGIQNGSYQQVYAFKKDDFVQYV